MDLFAATGSGGGEYVVFDFWQFLGILLGAAAICVTIAGGALAFSIRALTRLATIDANLATVCKDMDARDAKLNRLESDVIKIRIDCANHHPVVQCEG